MVALFIILLFDATVVVCWWCCWTCQTKLFKTIRNVFPVFGLHSAFLLYKIELSKRCQTVSASKKVSSKIFRTFSLRCCWRFWLLFHKSNWFYCCLWFLFLPVLIIRSIYCSLFFLPIWFVLLIVNCIAFFCVSPIVVTDNALKLFPFENQINFNSTTFQKDIIFQNLAQRIGRRILLRGSLLVR